METAHFIPDFISAWKFSWLQTGEEGVAFPDMASIKSSQTELACLVTTAGIREVCFDLAPAPFDTLNWKSSCVDTEKKNRWEDDGGRLSDDIVRSTSRWNVRSKRWFFGLNRNHIKLDSEVENSEPSQAHSSKSSRV